MSIWRIRAKIIRTDLCCIVCHICAHSYRQFTQVNYRLLVYVCEKTVSEITHCALRGLLTLVTHSLKPFLIHINSFTRDVTQVAVKPNKPWETIIIVNYAMSSWLKYGHNVCFCNIFLQDVGEQSRSDSNDADCQSATWIAV